MAQFGAGSELAAQCPRVPTPDGWRVDANVDGPYPRDVDVGDTIGKLKLVERTRIVSGHRRGRPRERVAFKCICECGNTITATKDNLARGHTESCGCARWSQKGLSRTPEYAAWRGMLNRCAGTDPHHKRYYQDRRISIDPRWYAFENFLADMGRMPSPGLTLERKDNDLDYTRDNCKWATWAEQRRNLRNNRWIEIDGVRKTLSEWLSKSKVPHSTVRNRIGRGVPPKLALELP